MRIESLKSHPHKLDELTQMLHEEWKAFAPWATPELIIERLNLSSSGQAFPFTYIALSSGDQLLGTASIKLRELPDDVAKHYWLGEVLIQKELRGLGIGSALIHACIDYTFNTVNAPLYLYTPDQQALYQRFGWVSVENRLVDGETVTVMELQPPSK